MEIRLGDVQETALITLAIRASESKRVQPRVVDMKAVEIVEAMNLDVTNLDKFFSHEGVVARTILIDEAIEDILRVYPIATCVNLGCGLDNRFERIDNSQITWYSVDLEDSIQLRQQFFTDKNREHTLIGDVVNGRWTENVIATEPVVVIAEGLFMYFSQAEVSAILYHIIKAFPFGFLVAELMHPIMMNKKRHDTLKYTEATFGWGVESADEILSLHRDLHFVRARSITEIMRHHSIAGKLLHCFMKKKANQVAVFRWGLPNDHALQSVSES